MTLLLAVNLASIPDCVLRPGLLRNAAEAVTAVYIPLLILACLGGLIWLEARPRDH